MAESTLKKFYHAWVMDTKEKDERYEYMFCSQFTALVVMAWDGPLGLSDDGRVLPAAGNGAILLPGGMKPKPG